MKLPIGISDFKELIQSDCQFIDKTLLIQEVIDDSSKVMLITRPRRFGKTLNLSMLYYFLQCNQPTEKNIFENLLISKDQEFCAKHQNQYPVIFISFKDIKKGSFNQAYPKIVNLISNLYKNHRYLLAGDILFSDEKELFTKIIKKEASQSDIEDSLVLLVEYMERKFKQAPIILMDEYDTPIQEAYLRGYYTEMIDLMRSILGETLKDSKIHKALVTGITRIAQESLFSGVNNFIVYSLLRQEYGQFFGFTEAEVVKLIEKSQQKIAMAEIKSWYNGYVVGKYVLYNPWSILHCLKNQGKLEPYWLNTSSNDLVKILISEADYQMKSQFELLLQGETIKKPILENLVFPELREKEEAIWSLLLYAGYLNVISTKLESFCLIAEISVPNKEVMYIYDIIVSDWFRKNTSLASYKEFIDHLKSGDMQKFKASLEQMLEIGSYFDFNKNAPEKVFHSFMLGLTVGLKDDYVIRSNQEAGTGRFDVIFMPKDNKLAGILMEFKIAKSAPELPAKAQEALSQIKDKQYFQIFKQHKVKNILAIGLAFCGKQVELAHEHI